MSTRIRGRPSDERSGAVSDGGEETIHKVRLSVGDGVMIDLFGPID